VIYVVLIQRIYTVLCICLYFISQLIVIGWQSEVNSSFALIPLSLFFFVHRFCLTHIDRLEWIYVRIIYVLISSNSSRSRRHTTSHYRICQSYLTILCEPRFVLFEKKLKYMQGSHTYPILGYSAPFRHFVPQKTLYPWGTKFVPHLGFSVYIRINWFSNESKLRFLTDFSTIFKEEV